MARKRNVARSPEELAKKRDSILDAAMKLLQEKGYTKTTMSDVAREAGIGRGTVYWHFDSKDDLFFELMEREVARMEEAMAPLLQQPMPALVAIDAMLQSAFQYYEGANPLFQAFLSILGGAGEEMERRFAARMAELYGQYNGMVAALLEQGKAEGTVRWWTGWGGPRPSSCCWTPCSCRWASA